MLKFIQRSFVLQLTVATAAVQTVLLGAFIWHTVVTQRKAGEDRLRERLALQLDSLAKASADEIARGDTGSLHHVLELSRIAPSIDAARLTDLQGNTLAATERAQARGLDGDEKGILPQVSRQQVFRIASGQLEGVTPVLQNGRPVALLWLEPNHAAVASTAVLVVRIASMYGALALIVNLLPTLLIVGTVTRPLRRLQQATAAVVRNPESMRDFPLAVTTRNEAGQLTGSVNAMVHELERQRRGMQEALALLDSMLSHAPIGLAFVDREMRYVRVNEYLATMHGRPITAHNGRTPSEFYPDTVGVAKEQYVRTVFATGKPIRDVELSGPSRHDPALRQTWQMHFYPVRLPGEPARWVGIVANEITDRVRAEETLRKTEKLAATGRLAASIAHEINNPLEAVTNLLYLLGVHEPMDAVASDYIVTAQAELARVSQITQQTLRFYRQSTSPTLANVEETFDAALVLYRSRVQSSGATVCKRFREPAQIFGFEGELRQVFANLVSNALDAMGQGGTLSLRAHRTHAKNAAGASVEGVLVMVADTGAGMPPKVRERIFEAFYTTKESTGTGLGLWVCEEVVRKHGGTIRVRSRQGEPSGTCFLVFFPDAIVERVAKPADATEALIG